LTVLHDCNKILDGHAEELRSALKHKKETNFNVSLQMLDPATVLSLFRRMTDEVHTFFHLSRLLHAASTTCMGYRVI
jgi:hypothetical protein